MDWLTRDQIKKAFGFVFEDEKIVVKLGIAAGLLAASFIIPLIPMFFFLGYVVVVMKDIILTGGEPALPEWEDWGNLLVKGLWVFGLGLIPVVPILFILNFVLGLNFATIAVTLNLPSDSAVAWTPVLLTTIGLIIVIAAIMISVFVALVWSLLYPAMLGYMVQEDRFGAMWRIKDWWRVFMADIRGFLLVFILVLAVNSAAAILTQIFAATVVLICILPLIYAVIIPYMMLVSHVLYAQAYRNARHKLRDLELQG